jgi:hypothetical protein
MRGHFKKICDYTATPLDSFCVIFAAIVLKARGFVGVLICKKPQLG